MTTAPEWKELFGWKKVFTFFYGEKVEIFKV